MSALEDSDREKIEDRREERRRALGTRVPRCTQPGCDESEPLALTGTHPDILCYEHDALCKGRPWLEAHHPSGRANDETTVQIPGNDHRVLSESQNTQWPQRTLRNPDGSPLLKASAAIRGWIDVLWLILTRTVGWVPAFLEGLDAWLRERLGPRWWEDFPGPEAA